MTQNCSLWAMNTSSSTPSRNRRFEKRKRFGGSRSLEHRRSGMNTFVCGKNMDVPLGGSGTIEQVQIQWSHYHFHNFPADEGIHPRFPVLPSSSPAKSFS